MRARYAGWRRVATLQRSCHREIASSRAVDLSWSFGRGVMACYRSRGEWLFWQRPLLFGGVGRPLPGEIQLMVVLNWKILVMALVNSAALSGWCPVSRARHCTGRIGSVVWIRRWRMCLIS